MYVWICTHHFSKDKQVYPHNSTHAWTFNCISDTYLYNYGHVNEIYICLPSISTNESSVNNNYHVYSTTQLHPSPWMLFSSLRASGWPPEHTGGRWPAWTERPRSCCGGTARRGLLSHPWTHCHQCQRGCGGRNVTLLTSTLWPGIFPFLLRDVQHCRHHCPPPWCVLHGALKSRSL